MSYEEIIRKKTLGLRDALLLNDASFKRTAQFAIDMLDEGIIDDKLYGNLIIESYYFLLYKLDHTVNEIVVCIKCVKEKDLPKPNKRKIYYDLPLYSATGKMNKLSDDNVKEYRSEIQRKIKNGQSIDSCRTVVTRK